MDICFQDILLCMESRTVMAGSGRKGEVEGPAHPVRTEWLGGSEKGRLGTLFQPHWEPGVCEDRVGLSPHHHTPTWLCQI